MGDCSRHKKEVAGISNMKELAEMIGDLHYEALAELLRMLAIKLNSDGVKDINGGRIKIGCELNEACEKIFVAYEHVYQAWKISEPFMKAETA